MKSSRNDLKVRISLTIFPKIFHFTGRWRYVTPYTLQKIDKKSAAIYQKAMKLR